MIAATSALRGVAASLRHAHPYTTRLSCGLTATSSGVGAPSTLASGRTLQAAAWRGFSAAAEGGDLEGGGPDKRAEDDHKKIDGHFDEEAFRMMRGSTRVNSYKSQSPCSDRPEYALVEGFQRLWGQFKGYVGTKKILLVDSEFDQEEFVESASDAFVAVNHLLGSGDLDTLKPMLCPRLHAAFVQVHAEYSKQGLLIDIEVEEVRQALVDYVKLLPLDLGITLMTVQKLESSEATESNETSSGNNEVGPSVEDNLYTQLGVEKVENSAGWLVVGVRFQSRERAKISNASGMVVADSTDKRGHVWNFIRGPLPPMDDLPASRLASPWKVLDLGPQQSGGFVKVN